MLLKSLDEKIPDTHQCFMFDGCIGLTSINIPNGVIDIGGYAFCIIMNTKINQRECRFLLGIIPSYYHLVDILVTKSDHTSVRFE